MRDYILTTEIKKIRAINTKSPSKIQNRKLKSSHLTEEERIIIINRFKKATRKLIIILNMLEIHKIQVQRMLQEQTQHWMHKQFNVFLKNKI
jgi:hypothetical protein